MIVSGDSFWTALAERSGDSAFCEIYRHCRLEFQSGVALRLPPQSKISHFRETYWFSGRIGLCFISVFIRVHPVVENVLRRIRCIVFGYNCLAPCNLLLALA